MKPVGTPVMSLGLAGHLYAVEQLHHQLVHRLEAALLHAAAFFADRQDLLLGLVQDGGHHSTAQRKRACRAMSSLAAISSLRRMARSRTISA